MPTQTASLHCPNPSCKTANAEHDKYCKTCGTRLVKRYLRATHPDLRPLEQVLDDLKPGQYLGERYLYKGYRIFLDTQPICFPDPPSEILPSVQTYLKLFAYRLHVPQPYTILESDKHLPQPLLLLESVPLNLPAIAAGKFKYSLMPRLETQWEDATPMRQLHWLWQLAQLWQPLKSLGAANTLLDSRFVRVEGPVVRLLELRGDRHKPPKLSQLGQTWLPRAKRANPLIHRFLQHWTQGLGEGRLASIDLAIAELEEALAYCSKMQTARFTIATATDSGPSRSHNEDACYPDPISKRQGTELSELSKPGEILPAIVCDGIGGHDGGEVASHQAISTLQTSLQGQWSDLIAASPTATASDRIERSIDLLDGAIRNANTTIAHRNDQEHRHERQRMGTTVVMAVVPPPIAQAHELYIAHVGDSRIYWMTKTGCYQVTLDDDLACREVRLGYNLYRNALQNRAAGALVQALGMGESSALHPTIGRLILDEDGVLLLCSDGLSDGDRVEQHWQEEILPVLQGKRKVGEATQSLIQLANELNGHDNATVGLIHYRIKATNITLKPLTDLFDRDRAEITSDPSQETTVPTPAPSLMKTELLPEVEETEAAIATSPSQSASITSLSIWIAFLSTVALLVFAAYHVVFSESPQPATQPMSVPATTPSASPEDVAPVEPPVSPEDAAPVEPPVSPEDAAPVEPPASPEDAAPVEPPASPEDAAPVEPPASPEDTAPVEPSASLEDTAPVEPSSQSLETIEEAPAAEVNPE
ncbi:protein phosphatase 2C domain-containing protein [Roseofilum casamattae]|uniref:Protein phosphatase 2C domain-containing protein n=1 Tax=Roseofilum casamattae BLCC-M143 TaxID=3022442 RepID=A0ABT7C2T0_9CYAN|nr:protein phosphatase 2C domain-containing protein [Roseofilum casamattae]MDJ1185725.1 protein phosphatase 2C domain-containing protein [Roseofilum casamattae BLCC-M143]